MLVFPVDRTVNGQAMAICSLRRAQLLFPTNR